MNDPGNAKNRDDTPNLGRRILVKHDFYSKDRSRATRVRHRVSVKTFSDVLKLASQTDDREVAIGGQHGTLGLKSRTVEWLDGQRAIVIDEYGNTDISGKARNRSTQKAKDLNNSAFTITPRRMDVQWYTITDTADVVKISKPVLPADARIQERPQNNSGYPRQLHYFLIRIPFSLSETPLTPEVMNMVGHTNTNEYNIAGAKWNQYHVIFNLGEVKVITDPAGVRKFTGEYIFQCMADTTFAGQKLEKEAKRGVLLRSPEGFRRLVCTVIEDGTSERVRYYKVPIVESLKYANLRT